MWICIVGEVRGEGGGEEEGVLMEGGGLFYVIMFYMVDFN